MKTFRAADGRRVRERMTEEKRCERELLNMLTVITPVVTILVFALAAGVI